MNSSARLDDLAQRFQEDPRRYFAPLANEYRKSGEPGRAVELCREQLALHPGHLSGRVVLALALHDLGARAEARQAYQEALHLDPENVLVLRSLGDLARESGEPDMARDWYERAMGVDPRDPEVARRLAALEREQEQAPLSASDLSFTAALAAAQMGHEDEDPYASALELVEPGEAMDAAGPAEAAEVEAPDATSVTPQPLSAAVDEPGVADASAEFTAGFFATVLDEPAQQERGPAEPAADRPLDVGSGRETHAGDEPDFAERIVDERPAAEIGVGEPVLAEPTPVGDDALGETVVPADDMDRLFAELEPLTDDVLGGDRAQVETAQVETTDALSMELPSLDAAPPESLGIDLALEDGGAVVPDLPAVTELHAVTELEELPALDVFHDVGALEEVSAADVSAPESRPATGEETPASAAEGPAPLVADEWAMSLDSAAFEPEPAEYSATSSAPESSERSGSPEVHDAPEVPEAPEAPAPGAAFVTETMAQLYLQQGLTPQALDVYRQLSAERPDETHLSDRVAELEQRLEAEQGAAGAALATPSSGSHPVGTEDEPPAASWLQRLVRARPTVLGMPVIAGPETSDALAGHEPEPVVDVVEDEGEAAPAAVAELEFDEEQALDEEPVGAEELVVPPMPEPEAHDVSAFEWAIPESELDAEMDADVQPDVEATSPLPELEAGLEPPAAVEPSFAEPPSAHEATADGASTGEAEETRPAQLDPDDDPWIFEGERMAAAGLTGEWDAVEEAHDAPDVAPEAGPAVAQTLDEVLARPVSSAEEHAAGALVAATVSMQDDPEVNAQLGEAVAEDPASLLHLLRGTPRSVSALRQGASFSFDQFFRVDEPSSPAAGAAAGGTPPGGEATPAPTEEERGAGEEGAESDLADFHAWLSGLSKS